MSKGGVEEGWPLACHPNAPTMSALSAPARARGALCRVHPRLTVRHDGVDLQLLQAVEVEIDADTALRTAPVTFDVAGGDLAQLRRGGEKAMGSKFKKHAGA